MAFTITAESTPAYDGWGWDDYWDCYDWIAWHKAMLPVYGIDETNKRWLQAWNKQDTFFAAPVDCRTFNQDFKQYAKDNGFYDGLFEGIGFLAQPLSAGTSVVTGASDLVGDTADNSKYLKYVIPVVITLILIGIIVYGVSKIKKATPTPTA